MNVPAVAAGDRVVALEPGPPLTTTTPTGRVDVHAPSAAVPPTIVTTDSEPAGELKV